MEKHAINVEFSDRDVPRDLPNNISLCLFRVTQEALHNAAKHSVVDQFRVELSATSTELQLEVMDAGRFAMILSKEGTAPAKARVAVIRFPAFECRAWRWVRFRSGRKHRGNI